MKPFDLKPPMTVRRVIGRLAWIIKPVLPFIAAGAIFAACSSQDDTASIRALIDKGAALAEAHDISGILALASVDVRAMPMDLDHRGIKGILWRTFNYYGALKILYPRPGVELGEDVNEASVQFPFLIVKKERTRPDLERLREDPMAWVEALGEKADLYRLKLQLTKQDGDWLVARAFLERFTGKGFEG